MVESVDTPDLKSVARMSVRVQFPPVASESKRRASETSGNGWAKNMVDVAQLVRAPGCGSGGRGFETHHSPHFYL